MSSTSRSLIIAASVGVVEALKDQGLCRWNYAFRSLHQHAKKSIASYAKSTTRLAPCQDSSFSSSLVTKGRDGIERRQQSEESLRKVLYLSCWVPN